MQLPLFPLSTIVLPGGLLPLRLFEPRYINMVKTCFKEESGFGVCLIKDGHEAGAVAQPYPQGTSVSIVDFDQGADGLLHITAQGQQEFNLLSYEANSENLLIGEVQLIETGSPTPASGQFSELAGKLALILDYVEPNIVYPEKMFDEPDWVCNRMLELLPLSAPSKFEILQLPTGKARLDALMMLNIELN